jgi:hypothetical protein
MDKAIERALKAAGRNGPPPRPYERRIEGFLLSGVEGADGQFFDVYHVLDLEEMSPAYAEHSEEIQAALAAVDAAEGDDQKGLVLTRNVRPFLPLWNRACVAVKDYGPGVDDAPNFRELVPDLHKFRAVILAFGRIAERVKARKNSLTPSPPSGRRPVVIADDAGAASAPDAPETTQSETHTAGALSIFSEPTVTSG